MKDNTLRRTAIISLVVAAIFAVMIFVPEAAGIDGFDGGFAFSFVSLLIALTAGGVSIFYFKQAQKLNSIFCGEGVLAHWIYSSEYWKNYTRKEYLTEKSEKKILFIIISAFALFFGFLFWAFDPEAGFYVFLVMMGLIGLIAFVWRFSAWYNYRHNMKGTMEAYITKNAVYMNNRLYTWKSAFTQFKQVTLKRDRELNLLVFEYTIINPRTGPQTYSTRVPIPLGEEENAKIIMQIINQQN